MKLHDNIMAEKKKKRKGKKMLFGGEYYWVNENLKCAQEW